MTKTIAGRPIVAGTADGAAVVTDVPLSFWGGFDPATGEVIDRRHPLSGRIVSGTVLVFPHGRGSCSASGVLLEAIRNGTAPAAIVVTRVDPIVGLGAILAEELYGQTMPVVLITPQLAASIASGSHLTVDHPGIIRIERDRSHIDVEPATQSALDPSDADY